MTLTHMSRSQGHTQGWTGFFPNDGETRYCNEPDHRGAMEKMGWANRDLV